MIVEGVTARVAVIVVRERKSVGVMEEEVEVNHRAEKVDVK